MRNITPGYQTQTVLTDGGLPLVMPWARVSPAPPPNNRDTLCTIGAPDAKVVTHQDLLDLKTPPPRVSKKGRENSFTPVAFSAATDCIRSGWAHIMDAEPLYETFAIAGKEDRLTMYGKIAFPAPQALGLPPGRGLEVIFRGGWANNLAWQVAFGLSTFICANGCMSGDSPVLKLKNTQGADERFAGMVASQANSCMENARLLSEGMERWKDTPVGSDMFNGFLGVLQGRDLITTPMASSARKYWQACEDGSLHREHAGKSLFSAYQAVTGGLHRASPMNLFKGAQGLTKVTDAFSTSGGSLNGLPQVVLEIEEY